MTLLLPNPDHPTNALWGPVQGAKFWPCSATIKLPVRSDGALSLELLESQLAESAEARHCANAPMHQCTNAPMRQCTNAPMHQCTNAPMPQYTQTNASMPRCPDAPMS